LIEYIITEPSSESSDYKRCYKYPFIASEIMNAEIPGLIDALFGEQPKKEESEKN